MALEAAALRLRADAGPVIFATKTAMRTLGRRVAVLDQEKVDLDELLGKLVAETAPEVLVLHGVGIVTAAALLVAAGDNPERLRSEAAWAHLCGVAPLEASSGKVVRRRLNRGGDRQANAALWRIAMVRTRSDPRTRTYVQRRVEEGRSKPEIIRMLKGYIAREVYRHLPRAPSSRLTSLQAAGLAPEPADAPHRVVLSPICRPAARASSTSARRATPWPHKSLPSPLGEAHPCPARHLVETPNLGS